ncbi:MAG: ANTAR domain-containing protein [Rhodocyclaceae bacterium]
MLKVLVVDESSARADEICLSLVRAGYLVSAVLPNAMDLPRHVEAMSPDVILIDTESPSRDTLEHLSAINRANPRPVLLFSRERDAQIIRSALRAGVAAYVAETVAPERLGAVVEVALAQFEEHQSLRQERDDAARRLSERVTIERAKGLLMKARGLDEDAAYHALRRLAMARGRKLVEIAQGVVDGASLLM